MNRAEETRKLLALCHWTPVAELDQHVRDTITREQELAARVVRITESPVRRYYGNGTIGKQRDVLFGGGK